ncbi:MAG: SMC-Scp complex subunit ScpB [Gammaproteobacteria bacterium]
MNEQELKNILQAVIMAASTPMNLDKLLAVFPDNAQPERDEIRNALQAMAEECRDTSFELKEVSSGYRFQVKKDYADYVSRLWEERPARYSRALLETLALVAYRQPITRAEIENVRGVSVSSTIMKTLLERDWVKIVGHRDVPGKPAIYATTRTFLDYFNLKSLESLPPLAELRDLDKINAELELRYPDMPKAENEDSDEFDAEDTAAVVTLESAEEVATTDADAEDRDADVDTAETADDQPDEGHKALSAEH